MRPRSARSALLLAGALAGAGLVATAPAHAAPAGHEALYVDARPGQRAVVERALGMSGLRVHRRLGDRLQVVAPPSRVPALRRLPGVAAARVATGAVPDQVPRLAVSQGLQRTGGEVLSEDAQRGRGLVIAVLDLGFGTNLVGLQAAGELPPPDRLQTATFDVVAGLPGANAYGNRTNHGELVAQTVFDYAPEARYLFVNYRTEADFVAATDWLIAQRPDIVVHSNNFLEGPFDGTNALAQAVDRAAAADILWFNSAGNYALKHWTGQWSDPDADGDHDWADPAWSFPRPAGQPLTFALSWTHNDPATPTDVDLLIERLNANGTWTTVAASRDRQADGAPPAERITGWRPPTDGQFRVRLVHAGGPVPGRPLTMFSREIPLRAAGGSPDSSVPTPADAVGAIAVGAVTWRGDRLRNYSSWGPSDDGRLKPDLVAPTDTRVMGPNGFRGVGGTSNAAPNAAGAAALRLAALRRAGFFPSAADIRSELGATALDLGDPGPDNRHGAGRVRVAVTGPSVRPLSPRPGAVVRGVVRARFGVAGVDLASWTLSLGDTVLRSQLSRTPLAARLDTRTLPDGRHVLRGSARDFPGNVVEGSWAFRVDNTPPVVRAVRVVVGPRARPAPRAVLLRATPAQRVALRRQAARRPVRLRVVVVDPVVRGRVDVRVVVTGPRTRVLGTLRTVRGRPGVVDLGDLPRGRHRVHLRAVDGAGNARTVIRTAVVR